MDSVFGFYKVTSGLKIHDYNDPTVNALPKASFKLKTLIQSFDTKLSIYEEDVNQSVT